MNQNTNPYENYQEHGQPKLPNPDNSSPEYSGDKSQQLKLNESEQLERYFKTESESLTKVKDHARLLIEWKETLISESI